jgi:O-acetylhomoserine/O-acetylserine sulfhydrylase-like pyridoxal-dependent enzyme
MKTMELRMMQKCINTLILARFLASHPRINVNCNAIAGNLNRPIRDSVLKFGLSAPLFTIDFEQAGLDSTTFVRFFDSLEPAFHHQVTLGQSNTVILCPAMTSHSEMDDQALADAGIVRTTIRVAIGDENPKELIAHFVNAARLTIDPEAPGFSDGFLSPAETDALVRTTYLKVHEAYIDCLPPTEEVLK